MCQMAAQNSKISSYEDNSLKDTKIMNFPLLTLGNFPNFLNSYIILPQKIMYTLSNIILA